MSGMMQQLLETMNDQAQRYEELLGLALEKKDVVVQNDVEGLQKITNLENILISQNNRLEKKRLSLVTDIAEVLGQRGNDLDIAALIELMTGQPEEQKELKAVGDRIRDALKQLKEANDFNSSLIQNALDYIEYSMNLIRSSAQQTQATYSVKDGQLHEDFSMLDVRN